MRRLLVWFCLALLAAPGCTPQEPVHNNVLSTDFPESARMLLAPAPFRTICLEVDFVVGAEPPEGSIDELAAFLRDTCQKPVSVVTRKPIPAAEAATLPPRFLALQRMNGPPACDANDPTAYVYVLLYRGAGEGGGYVCADYPCAMFLEMGTTRFKARSEVIFGLKHEAGHMLTLCSNREHGDGAHCNNRGCLMYKTFSICRSFLGIQGDELCAACQRDLSELKRGIQPTGLRSRGPFLVRRERGYFVARLPKAVHLEIGEPEGFDWQEVLDFLRGKLREMRDAHAEGRDQLVWHPGAFLQSRRCGAQTIEEYLRKRGAIEAAAEDVDPTVRQMARELKAKMEEKFGRSPASRPGQ